MAFADFPEQRLPLEILQRSLASGRLAHAYLFTGTDLRELQGLAKTLAKVLNCQNPVRVAEGAAVQDSCDRCLPCRKIEEEIHPDIQWVRPESKSRVITIDQMRDTMQVINLKPTEAQFKVAIVAGADRLNVQAGNAFLKTLEEPPSNSIILLLSTEPDRMIETLVSRCLRLRFGGESGRQLHPTPGTWLESFADLSANSGQGILPRYKLLGVVLAEFAKLKAGIETVLTDRSPLQRYEEAETKLRQKWEEELTAAIEAEYRGRRAELLATLQLWFRDVWLQTLALKEDFLQFPRLAAISRKVAQRLSPAEALQNIESLEKTQRLLSTNVQEALTLEVGLLKLKL